jgi:hypothetical protein
VAKNHRLETARSQVANKQLTTQRLTETSEYLDGLHRREAARDIGRRVPPAARSEAADAV